MSSTNLTGNPPHVDTERISVRLFGATELLTTKRRVRIDSALCQGVLTTLALHPHRLTGVESIAATLWERPPTSALRLVQNAAENLRELLCHTFAEDCPGRHPKVIGHAGGYMLHAGPEAIDVLLFDTKTANAHAHAAAGDFVAARTLYREALALHRGRSPRTIFTMSGSAPGLQAESLRIHEKGLCALEDGIEVELALGAHAEVIPELCALVAEFPLRQRARGHLVLALTGVGRTQDAAEVYHAGVRLLSEAGLRTTPELTDAYRAAVGDAEPGSVRVARSTSTVHTTPPARVPAEPEDAHTFRLRADPSGGQGCRPPAHLRAVLDQLLSGATDTTASKRLGLSPRTYSRRVSELLDYLGVASRFQAGAEALHRGWITPSRSG